MTVQELFEQADRQAIAYKIACFDISEHEDLESQEKEDMIKEYESYIMESFAEILSIIPDDESELLVICVYQTDLEYIDNCYISVSGIKKHDLKTKEIYRFNPDDTVDEDTYSEKYIQSYALEFTDWNEILAMEVGQSSIDKYGINECAEAIYREMTFCGIFYDDHKMASEEQINNIMDAIASIEAEDIISFTPDELLEELEIDKMTEEEKNYMGEIVKEELTINLREQEDIILKERDYILKKEA